MTNKKNIQVVTAFSNSERNISKKSPAAALPALPAPGLQYFSLAYNQNMTNATKKKKKKVFTIIL